MDKKNITLSLNNDDYQKVIKLKEDLSKKNVTQVFHHILSFYIANKDKIVENESVLFENKEQIIQLIKQTKELEENITRLDILESGYDNLSKQNTLLTAITTRLDKLFDSSISREEFNLLRDQVAELGKTTNKLVSDIMTNQASLTNNEAVKSYIKDKGI